MSKLLNHLNQRNWCMKHKIVLLCFLFLFVTHISYCQEEISLEQVIALALEKNYDVQLAKNVSEAASTDNKYAFGAFLPQLEATGATVWSSNYQKLRFEDTNRNDSGRNVSNNTTASLQLTWTLFDGTRMFATRER